MTSWHRTCWAACRLAVGIAAVACGAAGEPRDRAGAPRAAAASSRAAPCDSARAARVALDSLDRLDPFRSAVRRFERDSAGVRLVTGPAPGVNILDGAAIVRVDLGCRITSLVQTDSA